MVSILMAVTYCGLISSLSVKSFVEWMKIYKIYIIEFISIAFVIYFQYHSMFLLVNVENNI